MKLSFAGTRRRGVEWLDDPAIDPAVRARSIADVVRSNRLLGGRRAAIAAIGAIVRSMQTDHALLLDVGTGLGDIPARASDRTRATGTMLTTIGLDCAASLLVEAGPRLTHPVCGSVLALPMRSSSVDIVTASQLLHHFENDDAVTVLRELHRVARHAVVVSDLRRSWIAAVGFWLVSWPLRFHAVTRHDGVVSVLRGFTASELASLVQRAVGIRPRVVHHLGFRLTATWTVDGRAS